MSDIRTSQRKAIRDAVVSKLLVSLSSFVGTKVYPQRKIPIDQESLPVVLVYTNSEKLEKLDNINVRRTLSLSIEIQNSGTDEKTVSDLLEEISEQIEITFMNDEKINNLVDISFLNNIEEAQAEDGDEIISAIKLDYEIIYYTENVAEIGENVAGTISANIGGLGSTNTMEQ